MHCKHFESRLDWLTLAMTSLIKMLVGEGTGQAMEYEEELVQNVPSIYQNAIVSLAKKVKDNILHMMIAPIITLLPAIL